MMDRMSKGVLDKSMDEKPLSFRKKSQKANIYVRNYLNSKDRA